MFSKSVRIIPVAAGLTVLILGFQNCSQARFSPDTGTASLKSTDGGSLVNGMPVDPSSVHVQPDALPASTETVSGTTDTGTTTPGSVGSIPPAQASGTHVCHHETEDKDGDDDHRSIASSAKMGKHLEGKDHDDEEECEEHEGGNDDDGNFAKAFSGVCELFEKAPSIIEVPASALDSDRSGNSSNVFIEFAKNVRLTGNSGNILVKVAASTVVSNNSGHLIQVRSKVIPQASGDSGRICLVANSVGAISGVSAHTKVIAKSIDSISGQSGDLHVYGAVIQKITNSSGRVCLHDGATVLNQSGNSGSFFAGDCK